MPFSPKSLEEKPYNACLNCGHIGKNCDGPNFLTMTSERWSEWCRLRKEYLGWTNAKVAELANISKISVDRVMSGNIKDIRTSTMQAITKALVNGSWGKYPCAMSDFTEEKTVYVDNPETVAKLEKAEDNCRKLEAAIDKLKDDHRSDIKYMQDQMVAKDKLLSERYDFLKMKDRTIKALSMALTFAAFIIIAALIMDKMNPELGFLWLTN